MGDKIKKVSIITTFYNAEKFIFNTLTSINQQIISGYNLEYILVDDKSKDKSREIVDDFINKYGNKAIEWRVIEPATNLGCGGARKYGIDHATGDYFMFVDADDYYIHTDFVLRAINDITTRHADIVEYGVIFNQPNGNQVNNTAPKEITIENNPSIAEISLFKDNLIKFNVWSKIYTREIVESYPYSTERTYEDVRTIPVWLSNAKKIVVMPTPEINYRAATGSIIRTDMIQTRLGTITAIAELFPRFKDDFNVLKAMYGRAMVDLEAVLSNHSSNDDGFNEMSRLNTKMLKYLYPDTWEEITYHIEDDPEVNPELNKKKINPDDIDISKADVEIIE